MYVCSRRLPTIMTSSIMTACRGVCGKSIGKVLTFLYIVPQPSLRSWTWLYLQKANITTFPMIYRLYGNILNFHARIEYISGENTLSAASDEAKTSDGHGVHFCTFLLKPLFDFEPAYVIRKPRKRRFQWCIVRTEIFLTFQARVEYVCVSLCFCVFCAMLLMGQVPEIKWIGLDWIYFC